ncbi:MAG: hypothetical protein J4F34_00715 [Gemmatimonadetes bacterium]|nr:hypothetical protein [Gemmatimonadota bacterium]
MSAGEEGRGIAADTGSEPADPKERAGVPEASDPKEEADAPMASDAKEKASASEASDPEEKASAPKAPDPKEEAGASEAPDPKEKAGAPKAPDPKEEAGTPEAPDPKAEASRVGFGVPELPEAKRMERLHCAGRQVPSPVGGFVMALGVRQEEDRTSTILFECKTSALRYELPMRVSGWRERRKVRIQVEEGLDPLCPRAELGPPLVRRGKDFYCPRCNIWFGRVP